MWEVVFASVKAFADDFIKIDITALEVFHALFIS